MTRGFSPTRAGLIAGYTLKGIVRQRFVHATVFSGAVLVFGSQLLGALNFGASELKFLADFGFGAIGLLGSLLAVVLPIQSLFAEVEHRTALTLLAKPLRHSEFIIGQQFACVLALGGFTGVLTLLLGTVLWSHGLRAPAGIHVDFLAIAAIGFTHWLKFCVAGSFALLIATLVRSPLLAFTGGFSVLAVCHLQYLAHEIAQRGASLWSAASARSMALVFPNFQIFNFADALGAGLPLQAADVLRASGYAFGYVAIIGALAAWSFRHREI